MKEPLRKKKFKLFLRQLELLSTASRNVAINFTNLAMATTDIINVLKSTSIYRRALFIQKTAKRNYYLEAPK